MDPVRRTAEVERLEQELQQASHRVAVVREKVGDPESVVDRHGYLPVDRRCWSLVDFSAERAVTVRELRSRRDELGQQIVATPTSRHRSLKSELSDITQELALWVAIPEPAVEEMCSECPKPVVWHERSFKNSERSLGNGPCPAYPSLRAALDRFWEILRNASAGDGEPSAGQTPPPPRRDPRTKAQLLEEIDRLQARLTEFEAVQGDIATPPVE